MPTNTTIIVQIERVLFFKEDSKWGIYKTNPCATGDAATTAARGLICKGVVPFDVKEGDRYQLEGYFEEYQGQTQFRFFSAVPNLPLDLAALLHYAVSITKGLGEAREAQIWATYRESWITQERLEIDGLPEKVQFQWADTLRKINENKAQTQAITFLMSRGCTQNMATVAWNEWKENTIGRVNANFYDLAQLPHYGFKTVDEKIRPFFEMPDDDPRRLAACILYVIGELGSSGDTLLSGITIGEEVQRMIPAEASKIKEQFNKLASGDDQQIIIMGNLPDCAVCLASDFKNEEAVFRRFER